MSLCKHCSCINFSALRYPTLSDIARIRDGDTPQDKYPFRNEDNIRSARFTLGFLSDIKLRKDCQLCRCIWRHFRKLNVYSDVGHSALGENVLCIAEIGLHWGLFNHPDNDSETHCKLYRLAITTYIPPRHTLQDYAHLHLDHYFQPCDVGAGSIETNEYFKDPRDHVDMTVFGGRKRPLQIKIEWLKRWIQICDDEHGDSCGPMLPWKNELKMDTIRLIDVREKCLKVFIRQSLIDFQYIALSYVWGQPSPIGTDNHAVSRSVLELNTVSASDLEKKGALERLGCPQTIADVIDLAAALGVPYVWIDRLCIQQDSDEDKGAQISKMHIIYNASYLTVVAAAGKDVHHGLPGLKSGTRYAEQEEIIVVPPCTHSCKENHQHDTKGLSLLTSAKSQLRSEHYLETSTWNQRGWTLQEQVLARRSLIFTDEKVYWSCSDATFFEDSYCELAYPRFQFFTRRAADLHLRTTARSFNQQSDPQERFWATFNLLVKRYSQRLLSYPGDGHDAFAAILQALRVEMGQDFIWGIPISYFELGLSWTTFVGQRRRTALTTLAMTQVKRRVEFPSWSWMGWEGEADVMVGNERVESEKPEIQCYVHRISLDGIELISVRDLADKPRSMDDVLGPVSQEERARLVDAEILKKYLPMLNTAFLSNVPENHLLFFWASIASFQLQLAPSAGTARIILDQALGFVCNVCVTTEQHLSGAPTPTNPISMSSDSCVPQILDREGGVVGSACRMFRDDWNSRAFETGLHQFIVVGRRHIAELGDEFPATLLVMQVERQGDIYYRINMGEIEEEAWKRAEGELRLIALG